MASVFEITPIEQAVLKYKTVTSTERSKLMLSLLLAQAIKPITEKKNTRN